MRSFRSQLTKGERYRRSDHMGGVDPAGAGHRARVRVGRGRWFNLLWLLPIGFLVLIVAVAAAKGLRNVPSVERFIVRYPGTIETARAKAHPGLPIWVGVQHFFNLFLLIFIIRSGVQSSVTTLGCTGLGLPLHSRQRLVPHPETGSCRTVVDGEARLHQPAAPGWSARDPAFNRPRPLVASRYRFPLVAQRSRLLRPVVHDLSVASCGAHHLVCVSQRRVRADPVSVVAVADRERMGRVQQPRLLAYFVTIFVAAPLALITGLGMSPALSTRFKRISKVLSIQTARSLHFLVLVWFLVFIVMHVTLVFTTGLLNNLNHVYAARNDDSWIGFTGSRRRWSWSSSAGLRRPRSRCATPASCSESASR